VKRESVFRSDTKDVMSVDYKRAAIFVFIFWTVLIGAAVTWTFFREQEGAYRAALETGRSQIKMYILSRNLGTGHSSVNVPLMDKTQPNQNLKGDEEAGNESPSGPNLTLLHPFNRTPQNNDADTETNGFLAHLTSLNPLNQANIADNWEIQALHKFEAGETEVNTIELIDSVKHLQLMLPLTTESACMSCHQMPGIKQGEFRSGVSITFPLTPYLAIARDHSLGMGVGFGFFWILGVFILVYAVKQLKLRKKERLLAIHELQASHEKYQTLFSQMLDGFAVHELIWDPEGVPSDYRFLSVNPAFERLTGLKAQDVEGKTVLEIIPNTEHFWIATYGQVVLTGEPVFVENYSEGLGKHFKVTAFKSAPNQFVTIFADVTEQKRIEDERLDLEKQLMQSQRLETVGTMVGGVSHELNNVLQSMFLYGGLIQDELPPDSELHKSMQQLLDDAERARDLVNQILTFSRKSEITYESQQIHEIILSALNFTRASLSPKIKIEHDLDQNCPRVPCDQTQIHQMVINLCKNSKHAMGENEGTIHVSLHKAEAKLHKDLTLSPVLELIVSDTGHGMDEDILERIFDPFFTTKSLGNGTGLGLSVVYGIVRMMNGEISATSKVGKGTSFKVLLPVATDSKTEKSDATSQ